MRLTRRFTFALIVGVLLIQAGFAGLRVWRERRLFELDGAREQKVLGRSLALAAEMLARSAGEAMARQLVERANLRDSHVTIRWIALDGDADANLAPRVPLAALSALRAGEQVVYRLDSPAEAAVYAYTPVVLDGGRVAAVEVSDPWRDESAYVRQSILNAVLSTLALVSLCGVVGWALGLLFVGRPIHELVLQARRVGQGDLATRVALEQRDELGELAAEMNEMSSALARARERLLNETQARIAALEQLKHVDRLRTTGTLASGIAHELGTPLNVVDGHAQLIVEDAGASEEVRDNAKIITRQARRMTGIIRQLLDFARREQSEAGSSDVAPVAERALAMTQPLARKRDVELSFRADQGSLQAEISAEELTQVLVNVVINGIQAMDEGGKLTVTLGSGQAAPPWSPDLLREMIHIVVEDEGKGMSAEDVERVFEPFFTTKEVGEGTGLGLSVAFGIIAERQGWITVESAPGRGSRFAIFVPPGEVG